MTGTGLQSSALVSRVCAVRQLAWRVRVLPSLTRSGRLRGQALRRCWIAALARRWPVALGAWAGAVHVPMVARPSRAEDGAMGVAATYQCPRPCPCPCHCVWAIAVHRYGQSSPLTQPVLSQHIICSAGPRLCYTPTTPPLHLRMGHVHEWLQRLNPAYSSDQISPSGTERSHTSTYQVETLHLHTHSPHNRSTGTSCQDCPSYPQHQPTSSSPRPIKSEPSTYVPPPP